MLAIIGVKISEVVDDRAVRRLKTAILFGAIEGV